MIVLIIFLAFTLCYSSEAMQIKEPELAFWFVFTPGKTGKPQAFKNRYKTDESSVPLRLVAKGRDIFYIQYLDTRAKGNSK